MGDDSGCEVRAAKLCRNAGMSCSYWLTKRNRYCLTKPIPGQVYCEVHLEFSEKLNPDMNSRTDDTLHNVESSDKINSQCSATEKNAVLPTDGRCNFWLAKKRRFCKLFAAPGRQYCVEHSVTSSDSDVRTRIPCPKDPKHSCYADQLESHLKKCNSRDDIRPVYFSKGINSGDELVDSKASIRDLSNDEIQALVCLVNSLHKENVQEIGESELFHESLREEVNKPGNGNVAHKHLCQQASLIGHMDALGLLRDNTSYVEFGAGKGGLSHWIQQATADRSNVEYILVDRSSVRYKKDSYHKGEDQGPSFQRLKIDIEHLNLGSVPSIALHERSLVGVGKHLCGGATDLMLRCLAEAVDKPETQEKSRRVEGLVVALCCHHRCDWTSYVGKQWFRSRGIDVRHFQLMVSMSAWATCSSRTEIDEIMHKTESSDYNHPRYGSMDAAQREVIGIRCKQLLDAGRVHYLVERGFSARIVNYTSRNLTLENMALTAVRSNKLP